MKWASNVDGIRKDGVFTCKNPPSFSFKYLADFVITKPFPGNIFRITFPKGSPIIDVSVGKITGDVKKSLEEFAEEFKNYLENSGIGTNIKIDYNKPLPPDNYGDDSPAQEFEIDWKYQGTIPVTTYVNVIAKEGYYIAIIGRTKGDSDRVKEIFKTIKLEP